MPVPRMPTDAMSEVREPEGDLALGRLLGVGAVHEVLAVGQGQVAADGSGGRLASVGDAVELTHDRDRLVALEHERHERPGGDELAEWRVPRLVDVLSIMRVGLGSVDLAMPERDGRQS